MQALYIRTAFGDREIAERQHALTRWQRTTLIVIGAGKRLHDLQRELRQMPDKLETILSELIERGLVTSPVEAQNLPVAGATANAQEKVADPLKEARRYLTYLISIIENTDASAALGLAIKLRKSTGPDDIQALQPLFLDHLSRIRGEEEAQRLLAKLSPA